MFLGCTVQMVYDLFAVAELNCREMRKKESRLDFHYLISMADLKRLTKKTHASWMCIRTVVSFAELH